MTTPIENSFQCPTSYLTALIPLIKRAVKKDPSRKALHNIRVDSKDGVVTLTAVDGRLLISLRVVLPQNTGNFGFSIPVDLLNGIKSSSSRNGLHCSVVEVDGDLKIYLCGGVTLAGITFEKLHEKDCVSFPNWIAVCPTGEFINTVRFSFDVSYLAILDGVAKSIGIVDPPQLRAFGRPDDPLVYLRFADFPDLVALMRSPDDPDMPKVYTGRNSDNSPLNF